MERENKTMPALCLSGCGFHGNPATEGLCSVCYKESQKKKEEEPTRINRNQSAASNNDIATAQPTIPKSLPDILQDDASTSSSTGVVKSCEDQNNEKDLKKKKNRCSICRKKVGLTGIQCRCGGVFCGLHRYSDTHNCTFDYRTLGAQEISQSNPKVVRDKIQKI